MLAFGAAVGISGRARVKRIWHSAIPRSGIAHSWGWAPQVVFYWEIAHRAPTEADKGRYPPSPRGPPNRWIPPARLTATTPLARRRRLVLPLGVAVAPVAPTCANTGQFWVVS